MRLVPLVGVLFFATSVDDADIGAEPQGRYELRLDGTTVSVVPGEPVTVTLGDREVEVQLEVPRHRHFEKHGVRFDYPAGMGFEYDGETPGVHFWTLDGNDAVLMVQEYEFDIDEMREALEEGIAGEFEAMGATVEGGVSSLPLSTGKVEGVQFDIRVGEVPLFQELYCIEIPRGTLAIVLQDSPDPGEGPTEEFQELRRLICETLDIDS